MARRRSRRPFYDPGVHARLGHRLARAEGQLRALRRLLEEGRRCPEVLQQAASVREAIRSFERALLRNYLETCATRAIRAGGARRTATYDEMMAVIGRYGA